MLLVATSSDGTRMKEGTPAFVEMVAISKAVVAHKAAGLAYLTGCASAICELSGPAERPASPTGPQGSKVNDGV